MLLGDNFSYIFTVSSEIYNGFLETFNDYNSLHTNKDFAISKGFRDVVMHGNILNGFLSYFIGQLLPTENVIIIQQDIKFHLPVFLNDELHFTAQIIDIHDSVNAVEFKFEFKNTLNKKVAKGSILIGRI